VESLISFAFVQMQRLALHLAPWLEPQLRPHTPQLVTLVVVSVHVPPQQVVPTAQSESCRQGIPRAHRGQVPPPPQSTPVSTPFFTLSVQLGWQTPCMHTPPTQSPVFEHFWPGPQPGQGAQPPSQGVLLPQSTSVSAPFKMPSMHVAMAHVLPPMQWRLSQSPLAPQLLPVPQRGHIPPPQSTSDSFPSRTPFVQLGRVQTPLTHVFSTPQLTVHVPQLLALLVVSVHVLPQHEPPFAQSPSTMQCIPRAHPGQVPPPPQSTSVSFPFITRSEQSAARNEKLRHPPAMTGETAANPTAAMM
jgi:hypothetical protein